MKQTTFTSHELKAIARELFALLKAENRSTTAADTDELMSIETLCRKLDVSSSWVKHRSATLPRVKIGGTFRYPFKKCLEVLIAEGRSNADA